ncbi:MAG TPA: S8 family serine peptidase [Thermoanaerobaculia bacterium]|nr:S8 family serine peptidase [Thermoanaerobaculia bacterium]
MLPEGGRAALQQVSSTLQTLGGATAAGAVSMLRRLRAAQLRESFYEAAAPLRERMGQAAGLRQDAAPGTPGSITQVCWLNSTLRTVANLPALADVAHDSKVERIGLPRLLRPEAAATLTEDLLDGARYRARKHVTGEGVVVAVLDAEIAYKHRAFGGRVKLKENYTREGWGHPSPHGTAVAGLIAADAPSFAGVAPRATIYHYKVLATAGPNHADDFGGIQALQQALEDGAHIANCSWGIGSAGNGTSREARGFDEAWNLGLAIVKSAGNDGGRGLSSPADAAGAIVVGATGKSGKKMIPESSRGPAPNGRNPDCVAPGGSSDDLVVSPTIGGKIGPVEFGTSFAAALVSGVLALLLEKNHDQEPDDLRVALTKLCRKLRGVSANAQGKGLVTLG